MRPGYPILLLGVLGIGLGPGCGSDAAPTGTPAESCQECLAKQHGCHEDSGVTYCEPCSPGEHASRETGQCTKINGTPISMEFAEFTLQPGEEIVGLCQSVTLNNDTELWVQTVEMEQNEGSHHSIWTYVPDDQFEGPDEVWPCDQRDYSNLVASIYGGALYAQSTQAEREVQRFPGGAAIRIPPHSRIIGDVHLLNTTDEPLTGNVSLTVYSIPSAEVETKLTPFELEFQTVRAPAQSSSRLVGECDLQEAFADAGSPTVDMRFYYILPHAHLFAQRMFIEVIGGDRDGEIIFDDPSYANFEARGRTYLEPLEVDNAEGIRFGCEYQNPMPEDIVYGLSAEEEMCQYLAYVESPVAFSAYITELEPTIEEKEDMKIVRAASCRAVAVPWSHDKPGGGE